MNGPLPTITGGPAYPVDFSLVEHIEAIIQRYPSNVAAFDSEQRLTYSDIRAALLTLHARLHELGLRSGDVVAVNATVQLRYPVLVLGLLLAGLVYLPIAAALPPERKRLICEQARPAIIITDSTMPDESIRTSPLSTLFSGKPAGAVFDQYPEPSPEATAYVIFTSGSTGVPKGVSIPRKGLLNRLQWARDYYTLGSEDVTALKTQASFDPSIQEAVLPFFSAGAVFVPDHTRVNFPNYLSGCIREHGVTMLIMVPSHLQHLLASPAIEACQHLRHIVCCGEPWGVELISELHARLPGCRIYNGYGPTEATIGTLVFNPPRGYVSEIIPIGKPIAGTHVAIIDDDLRPVPSGEAGELIIGGICVGNGYLNNPQLTERQFRTLPVEGSGEVRFYFSGDMARALPNGDIVFLGRKDNQVKINGVRIELEEVELALRNCPGVSDAIVVKREGKVSDELHAFLIAQAPLDTEAIATSCVRRLGQATTPSRFFQVDAFPLNQNGKVDRQALAAKQMTERSLP
ncbi:amino acid adenylation domain-containing protein [Pseudomonas soli]|uniref:amino acid adenylation domain-containing protein n=1 Tax=Pseudomonas soli TaxID=1306993 RepID=UPI0003C78B0E